MLLLSVTGAQSALAASWSLNQYCQLYGPMRVDVGQAGAKLSSKKIAVYINGNGHAGIYNHASRTYCDVSTKPTATRSSYVSTPGQVVKGGSKTVLNLRANQYWCGGFDSKGRQMYSTEFWTTNDLNIPASYTDGYLKMCGLPAGLGLPIGVIRHYGDPKDPKHRRSVFLDTSKVTPANFSPSEFVAPTGYKQVADEMEVLVGDQLE
jgi:hypothetical protein